MDRLQLEKLFTDVREGRVAVADAVERMAGAPTADLGFATVDQDRASRCGFPEVVYCEGKTPEQVAQIMGKIAERESLCLATRVRDDQIAAIRSHHPSAQFDHDSRIAWLGEFPDPTAGKVVVVTAGTSDLPVAREAELTARALGSPTKLIADVGVAGLHRLLARLPDLADAAVVIVVAGMEGALPSVVGGLVACPVIAVPTSIGYGANFQGVSALLCMLTSCAANVAVVNIDAGFCGGFVAGLIARGVSPRR